MRKLILFLSHICEQLLVAPLKYCDFSKDGDVCIWETAINFFSLVRLKCCI